jgi:glycosyltransferase involved in cell wall biosynthesis
MSRTGRRARIDVFARVDFDETPAALIHLLGVWRRLGKRYDVCLWVPRPRGVSLAGEPFRLEFTAPPAAEKASFRAKVARAAFYESAELLRLVWKYRREKPDALYVRETPLLAPAIVARFFRIPLFLEMNGALLDEWGGSLGRCQRALLALLLRHQARSAARILAMTGALADFAQSRYAVPAARIQVIPNGADVELFQPGGRTEVRRRLGFEEDIGIVCWVGTYQRWQGVEALLDAFTGLSKRVEGVRLLLVVKPLGPSLKESIRQRGIGARTTVVSVPHERVADYITASDVCAAPFADDSRNRLTGLSPLKLWEYLACGRPVVASRLPDLQFIEDNQLGCLFSPGDAESLRECLQRLLQLRGAERDAMTARCRAFAVDTRSWDAVAGRIENQMSQLLH